MRAVRNSSIYKGWIRHRRFKPKSHDFSYPIFMLYLDLDELDQIIHSKWYCSYEHFNVVSFRRSDYFSPESEDLKHAVIEKVKSEFKNQGLASPDISTVRLLSHARYFGFVFNPVSFYYCFDSNEKLVAILAEITNTPWGERHTYTLPVGQSGSFGSYQQKAKHIHDYSFDKDFHVSPFNPMNMRYHWVFSEPDDALRVHMDNYLRCELKHEGEKSDKHFDATLVLNKRSIQRHLGISLIQFPLLTVRISMGIYWQAFRLWLKRMPFYEHPETGSSVAGHSDKLEGDKGFGS